MSLLSHARRNLPHCLGWRNVAVLSTRKKVTAHASDKPDVQTRNAAEFAREVSNRSEARRAAMLATLDSETGDFDSEQSKKKRKKPRQPAAPDLSKTAARISRSRMLRVEGWGADKLAPPEQPFVAVDPEDAEEPDEHEWDAHMKLPKEERQAPHFNLPIPHLRRIENYLQPSESAVLEDVESPSEHKPIATLAHGLDRVLFNPGVHWLQDPRSNVYNFTPWLEQIPDVNDFAFERLSGFIRSSEDDDLWTLAKREGRTYVGSTSSLSGFLSHVYFLLSGNREVSTSTLSRFFSTEPKTFTSGQRMPVSLTLNYRDGVYSFDSGWPSQEKPGEKTILTWMGTMLEHFLTTPKDDFGKLMRATPLPEKQETTPMREAYRYSKSAKFVMRSQLDCVDSRLPGTGVFDIKTRAALPIRLDQLNYKANSGYQIRKALGPLESFEKEYYDLIRSAFLKYSFQARMGNMDGVLVAYHNTARIFGFQYIPLDQMDEALFGEKGVGDLVFDKCVTVMESICDEVVQAFPEQSLKVLIETPENKDTLTIWVMPAEWTGDENQLPIAQYDVSLSSFIGDKPAFGQHAVSRALTGPWSMMSTICKSARSESDLRAKLGAALDRQSRSWNLPEDIGLKEMEAHWHTIDYGKKYGANAASADGSTDPRPAGPSYNSSYFQKAGPNIKQLRSLAHQGRQWRLAQIRAQRGKGKVVLGMDELYVDETMSREEADALALEEAEASALANAEAMAEAEAEVAAEAEAAASIEAEASDEPDGMTLMQDAATAILDRDSTSLLWLADEATSSREEAVLNVKKAKHRKGLQTLNGRLRARAGGPNAYETNPVIKGSRRPPPQLALIDQSEEQNSKSKSPATEDRARNRRPKGETAVHSFQQAETASPLPAQDAPDLDYRESSESLAHSLLDKITGMTESPPSETASTNLPTNNGDAVHEHSKEPSSVEPTPLDPTDEEHLHQGQQDSVTLATSEAQERSSSAELDAAAAAALGPSSEVVTQSLPDETATSVELMDSVHSPVDVNTADARDAGETTFPTSIDSSDSSEGVESTQPELSSLPEKQPAPSNSPSELVSVEVESDDVASTAESPDGDIVEPLPEPNEKEEDSRRT